MPTRFSFQAADNGYDYVYTIYRVDLRTGIPLIFPISS